jgi:DDE superfamily endonuclease
VHFGCVLADAGYGLSAPFRQALTARKLAWAVGIPRHLKVYSADVQMVWPVAKRGRPRQRHVPDVLSIPAEDMLAHAKWHTVSWRTGTKGKLKARFAAVRVRVADGPPGEWLGENAGSTDGRYSGWRVQVREGSGRFRPRSKWREGSGKSRLGLFRALISAPYYNGPQAYSVPQWSYSRW